MLRTALDHSINCALKSQPSLAAVIFLWLSPCQLLSRIKPNIKYRLHFDNFNERPAVAQAIAECIAAWSQVECAYGFIFISLLHANKEQGANLYAQLESGKAKRDANQGPSQLAASTRKLWSY